MRVLLVYPKIINDIYIGEDMFFGEPLGLEYVAAAIIRDHEVKLLDMRVEDRLEETLRDFKPELVGFSVLTAAVNTTKHYSKLVKEIIPETVTLVGGHHPTICPEDFDYEAIDVVSIGEGVGTMKELMEFMTGNRELSEIKGIAYRQEGKLIYNAPRPYPDLDSVPFPDRTLTAKYRHLYFNTGLKPIASLRTSKGCPYRCKFCCVWKDAGGKYYTREPEKIVEEIRTIPEPYIFLADDESFIDAKRMETLAELITKADLGKKFFSYIRADTVVKNKELMRKWKEAGLVKVLIGVESCREKDLQEWKKKNTTSVNEEAIAFMNEIGIAVCISFIVSQDYEEEDFTKVADYVKGLKVSDVVATILTPLPGTDLYDESKDKLLINNYDYFDCAHTVLPTKLSLKKFYTQYAHLLMKVSPNMLGSATTEQMNLYMDMYNKVRKAYINY